MCEVWQYGRTKWRALLASKEEMRQVSDQEGVQLPQPGKEETRTASKCTSEGAGYILECWDCRKIGKEAKYIGETSRSPSQGGKEYGQEVMEAKKTHPLVLHFQEKHNGQEQQIFM